ncbi:MAG: SprT-like domain-containing protein [Clostridia bacterium]|nr:SprT-like domain-containing protein [Clostridia bacterium]
MINISEIVAKTEAMFDLLNEHFYQKELIRPAITVSSDNGRGAYGWCSIYEIWHGANEAHREINITAEYINRPIGEVAATMLHEMAHLYNMVHEIKDVSNNGYYHNKKFKATAEAHGLHIEHHGTYGWTVTTLTEETAEWLAQQPGMEDFTASRKTAFQIKVKGDDDDDDGEETTITVKGGGRSTSKNRSIKYVCPKCGAIIRATKQVNVVCGDCDVPFERA